MKVDFDKSNGLVPAIIQDSKTGKVLMLGYMNKEALAKTESEGKATFFSRSKNRLWTKGETSGNYLYVEKIIPDCDNDTLLIKAVPEGPACHTGKDTCFDEVNEQNGNFLFRLEKIIHDRKTNPPEKSYTAELFKEGINKIAQKVGEEATEVVIDSVTGNVERVKEESADLLYHLLVLLTEKDINLSDVIKVLENRHK
jgi:phosphoribosyl-ATP pyrophosphohydrolase/phosphoribosyl-AMP cyclohydrolase